MRELLSVLCFATVPLYFACNGDPDVQGSQLSGHWVVYGASRDGRETTLLNRAVFLFGAKDSMETNVTGTESKGAYRLTDNTIYFDGAQSMAFSIESLHGDSMELATRLRDMQFNLRLHRLQTESQ